MMNQGLHGWKFLEITSDAQQRKWMDMLFLQFQKEIDLISDNIPVVLNVVRQSVRLNRFETGLFEVFPCFFFTPHGAQSLTTLRQGNRHAVHRRNCVEECADGVVKIFVDVA